MEEQFGLQNPTVRVRQKKAYCENWFLTHRGISGAQEEIEDGFFLRIIIKAFFDGLLLIFHTQEIFKSTTHNPGTHPTSLTMTSVPSPDGRIFIRMALFQQTKMKGDVADNLVSRHHCHCSEHTTD